MGILGKKKKHSAPSEDDFKLLDNSVSELSEQTNALLTHFGEKNSDDSKAVKPTMPQQVSGKKTPGRSFDIIQGSHAVMNKRAKKTVIEDVPSDAVELLPEHAGKSFNEVTPEETPKKETVSSTEASVEKPEEVDDSKKVAQAVLVGHPAGSLRFDSTEEEGPVTLHDDADSDTNKQDTDTHSVVEKVDTAASSETKDLDGTSETAPDDKKSEVSSESPKPVEKPEEEGGAETADQGEQKEISTATVEVFASNLGGSKSPKSYEPPEGQQQPTVFDTNEYHPELHDWSKLDHGHGGKWYVLALLIAIAAALAYFIFSGQKLPFIS
jgi:hypothetical protein